MFTPRSKLRKRGALVEYLGPGKIFPGSITQQCLVQAGSSPVPARVPGPRMASPAHWSDSASEADEDDGEHPNGRRPHWSGSESDAASEASADSLFDCSDSEQDGRPNIPFCARSASFGEALVSYLLKIFFLGVPLTAKSLCTICYLAWNAGAQGHGLEGLAANPLHDHGHHMRSVDRFLRVAPSPNDSQLLQPTYDRYLTHRFLRPCAARVPHTELLRELSDSCVFDDTLARAVRERRLPKSYFEHKVCFKGKQHYLLHRLIPVSYTHLPSPRDATLSRMPSSA